MCACDGLIVINEPNSILIYDFVENAASEYFELLTCFLLLLSGTLSTIVIFTDVNFKKQATM